MQQVCGGAGRCGATGCGGVGWRVVGGRKGWAPDVGFGKARVKIKEKVKSKTWTERVAMENGYEWVP